LAALSQLAAIGELAAKSQLAAISQLAIFKLGWSHVVIILPLSPESTCGQPWSYLPFQGNERGGPAALLIHALANKRQLVDWRQLAGWLQLANWRQLANKLQFA
jgi:hypothetical protein